MGQSRHRGAVHRKVYPSPSFFRKKGPWPKAQSAAGVYQPHSGLWCTSMYRYDGLAAIMSTAVLLLSARAHAGPSPRATSKMMCKDCWPRRPVLLTIVTVT